MKIIIPQKFSNILNKYKIVCLFIAVAISIAAFIYYQSEKPGSLNSQLREGENLAKTGKIAFALDLYNKLARQYPKNYTVHYKLGLIYAQVNEPLKAKIEFYRAIKLDAGRYEANFAMASLYASQDNWEMAEDTLTPLIKSKNRFTIEKIGDFYLTWGAELSETNQLEALRKFKTSYELYKQSNSRHISQAKSILENLYADIADKLVEINKSNDAIKLLNLSLNTFDNALAHYKLAMIYKNSNIDESLKEFDKAFKLNPKISAPDPYIETLIKKGNILAKKGDLTGSKYYYTIAQSISPKVKVPYAPDKHILVNLIATRYSENIDKDYIIPGVSFKIMNVSKDNIDYLKAKVVFLQDEKEYSKKIIDIATKESPIPSDQVTGTFDVYSPKSVPQVFSDHNIRIQIYISQKQPDNWKIYRNAYLIKKNKAGIRVKN